MDRILTSGLLLGDYFAREGLAGARTIVLGTDDSCAYVRDAGGTVVAPDDDTADIVVAADDDGYPFLDTVNEVISVLLRRLGRAQQTRLVLPNPDLIFPMDGARGRFGITAGAIAAMIEAVLRLRDPGGAQRFVPLGKPHLPMFEAAAQRFPAIDRRRMVMVGDTLGTDIWGAVSFGIDSVLVLTGVATLVDVGAGDIRPTYTLAGLS
jgi:ribonucleotide monophosphatase NagD (HAD superfamily)